MKTKNGNGKSASLNDAKVSAIENYRMANDLCYPDCVSIISDAVRITSANALLTSDAVRTNSGNVPLTSDAVLPTSDAIPRKKNAALRTTDAIRHTADATLHNAGAVRRSTDATRRTCAIVPLFKENANFYCFSGESKIIGNRHFSVFQLISSFFTLNTQFNPINNHP